MQPPTMVYIYLSILVHTRLPYFNVCIQFLYLAYSTLYELECRYSQAPAWTTTPASALKVKDAAIGYCHRICLTG